MKREKMKSKASVLAIRLQLLWIWFLKNITVFIRLAVIVCVILIFFGVIKFGDDGIIDAIFGDVINSWSEASKTGFKTVENVVAAVLSLGISVLMVMRKTNSITVKDIKSRKLKIAMLKANLYFNERGKLCKKLEEQTKMDLNGDGKVGDTDLNEIPQEITAVGAVRAAGELVTILTTPIDPNFDGNKVVEGEELGEKIPEETADAVVNEKLYTEDDGAPESFEEVNTDGMIEDEEEEDDPYDMDKELDKPFFLVRIFKDLLKALRLTKDPKIKKEKKHKKKHHKHHDDADVEEEVKPTPVIVVDGDGEQSLFAEEPVTTEEKPSAEETHEEPVVQETPKQSAPQHNHEQHSKKSQQIDDILNSLK